MLQQSVIQNPHQIEQQLKFLCSDEPIACQKQNQSETGSNHRIIYVRGNRLQYHNMYPQFSKRTKKDDPFQKDSPYFKASVRLQDIHQMQFLPKKAVKKKQIVLLIPQIKIQYKKPPTKVNNVNQLVKWHFYFGIDVKQYIDLKRKDTQRKQKQEATKIVLNMMAQMQNRNQEQQQNTFEQGKPIQLYAETIKKVKNYINLKEKIQYQEKVFNQTVQKKKQQTNKSMDNSFSGEAGQQEPLNIRAFWQLIFNSMDKLEKARKKQQKYLLSAEAQLLTEVAFFRDYAKQKFKQYINQKMVGWNPQSVKLQGFQFYKGVWIKLGGKQLNQQFNGFATLADILNVVEQVKGSKFRVPLMILSNYKCFKGLVMMDVPFSRLEKNQVFCLQKLQSEESSVFRIGELLKFLEKIMAIKHEPVKLSKGEIMNIPFGAQTKVFEYTGKKKQEQSKDYNTNVIVEPFYYILKIGECFPLDFNALSQHRKDLYLRPELTFQFRDHLQALNASDSRILVSAFRQSLGYTEFKTQQDMKVAKASTYLVNMKIPELVDRLNKIDIIYVDSYSIKKSFEEYGINIRYLNRVRSKTEVPYLQQMLKSQALARTIKKLYRQSMKDLLKISEDFRRSLIKRQQRKLMNSKMKSQNQALIQHVIDFLNLVFGKGQQTQAFWRIINQKSMQYYKIKSEFYPPEVKAGCLLHAVLWHCNLKMNFTSQIPLFKHYRPFDEQNFVEFIVTGDIYEYPSLEMNSLARMFPNLSPAQKKQTAEKISFNILKMDLLYRYSLSSDIQITLSQMNCFKENIRKPHRQNPLHPIQVTHYISNKSQANFQKAIEIINFALPNNHPLFLSLYNQYSYMLEKELLKKTCLLIAVKGLGQFHPKTTELYSKLYKQGFTQFQIKALRDKNLQQCEQNCAKMFQMQKYQSCLNFAISQVENRNSQTIKTSNQLESYIKIIGYGLYSANQTLQIDKGNRLSIQYSELINLFKLKEIKDHEFLIRQTLILKMSEVTKKYYLYKLVLLTIHIEQENEGIAPKDGNGLRLPVRQQERQRIIKGIIGQYYTKDNHAGWIDYIFKRLVAGFSYFNFLKDLFSNYKYHIQNYKQQKFTQSFGYLHLFVKLFGQALFEEHLYQIKPQIVKVSNELS